MAGLIGITQDPGGQIDPAALQGLLAGGGTIPAPAMVPQSGAAPLSAPPVPQQAQPQAAALSPPQAPQDSVILRTLDSLLLGGRIQAAQQANFRAQGLNYQRAVMQNVAAQLPDDATRAAFYADPQGFMAKADEQFGSFNTKSSDTVFGPGLFGQSAARFAPVVGMSSGGQGFTQTPQGVTQTGPIMPGKISVANGVISDENRGVLGTTTSPLAVAPQDTLHQISPTVIGGTRGPVIPQQPAAIAASGPIVPQVGQSVPPDPVKATVAQIRPNPVNFFSKVFGAPVAITSGARTAAHNAAVGGSPTSEHLTGSAWDIIPPPGVTTAQAAAKLASAGIPFDQIIDEGSHVHFGIGPKMRGQVLQSNGSGGFTSVGAPPVAPPQIPQLGDQSIPGATFQGTDTASNAPTPQPTGIVDGSQVPGGTPGMKYQFNRATQQWATVDGGLVTQQSVGTRGQDTMNSADYKNASTTASAVNGLIGAIKSTPPGTPLSWATIDTAMRAFNPTMGVRASNISAFSEELGLSDKAKAFLTKNFDNGGFIPPEVSNELLEAAYSYAEAHNAILNNRRAADVTYATSHGFKEGDLGESAPQMMPFPLRGRPDPSHMVRGRNYEINGSPNPKLNGSVMQWNGSAFVPPGK